MTVFKAFLKIFNKYKFSIILYTTILIFFAGINLNTMDTSTTFTKTKPDLLIINKDENIGVTKNLIKYLEDNTKKIKVDNNEDAINDALFYRDVNYVIYIPENYREDFLRGENPEIKVKTTGDFQATYVEMILKRYIKVANIYNSNVDNEEEIIENINSTLNKEAKIKKTSKLDTGNLNKAAFYFNFLNYSILAGCVYVISMILATFKDKNISKRITISSMNYKKHNNTIMIGSILLSIVMLIFYILLSFILIGKTMFTMNGLFYIINSFVFTICAVTIAVLISNLVSNKNAINGIINVVSLGSSFLCGVFVPIKFLPNSVVGFAHLLPSYWFTKSNELLKTVEVFDNTIIKELTINMSVILLFSLLFIIIINIITKRNRKYD